MNISVKKFGAFYHLVIEVEDYLDLFQSKPFADQESAEAALMKITEFLK